MALGKTLKIPSIEFTDNRELLIKEELPSLFPTGNHFLGNMAKPKESSKEKREEQNLKRGRSKTLSRKRENIYL